MSSDSVPVLEVEDLVVEFNTPGGVLRAVDGVSLSLDERQAIALVGESGSGKSVFARTLLDILAGNGRRTGTIRIGGRNIDELTRTERRHFFGVQVAMVFQDPMPALNPVKRIGVQITESLRYHLGMSKSVANKRAIELLRQVHIPSPEERMRQYPNELSGGMRQRVVIAMALACEPKLLIADEPTTALDVTVQETILDLLDELRQRRDMSMVLITHDLAVAEGRTDEIAVMYGGRIMEHAVTSELFAGVRHPYTEALLRSIPDTKMPSHTRLLPIPGHPPDLLSPPAGCAFAPRCRYSRDGCLESKPALAQAPPSRSIHACFNPVGTEAGTAALAANEARGANATGRSFEDERNEVN